MSIICHNTTFSNIEKAYMAWWEVERKEIWKFVFEIKNLIDYKNVGRMNVP